MDTPTQSQIYAVLRYSAGYIATGGAVLIAAGALPPATAHAIVDASQKVLDDLKQLIGDSYLLAAIVLPVVSGFIAKMGWNAASPKSQIASVQSLPQAQVVVTDPKLADGIPGVKVTK